MATKQRVHAVRFVACALAIAALWVAITPRSWGQDAGVDPDAASQTPAPPTGLGGPGVLGSGEVDLELEAFGVGNFARPGDWIGIRVRLKDTLAAQRNVIVRLTTTDSDGDSPEPQVEVTLNPGTWQGVWLYTRMQHTDISRTPIFVSAYEAVPATDQTAGVPKEELYRAGRLLARMALEPQASRILPEQVAMIAMLGNRPLGLRGYSQRQGNGEWIAPRGHEVTEIVDGLQPSDLPDRWMGLAPYAALVWGGGEIAELRNDRPRARALVDWVQRGGHLIIVLPPVGQNWTSPDANPVYEIMPAVVVERQENASMAGYRPLLTNRVDGPFPKTGVVHTFGLNPAAVPSEAIPILNGPDGKCVVVRRLVGAGAVTLIGINLNDTPLAQFNLIDADIFWHRVLGRRGNLSLPVAAANAGPLSTARSAWFVDDGISKAIAVTGKSAVGALVGFGVFALYWLFVGPPMFFVLRKFDRHRFAWLGFAVGTAVFTVLAWGAATLLRPSHVQAAHLTLMDHVYGQNVQRARMWASVLVPKYGSARIAVDDPSGEVERQLSAIAPWETPEDGGVRGSFPDARGYPIDARSPDAMTVPVRSTVKQVQCDWAGSPRWDMIRPVLGATDSGVGTLTLTPEWRPNSGKPLVNGFLQHNLPAPLLDAQLIVVRQQTRQSGNPSDFLPISANAYSFQGAWNPGDVVDLSILTNAQGPAAFDTLVNSLVPKPSTGAMGGLPGSMGQDRGTPQQRALALAFMGMLKPPEPPSTQSFMSDGETAALRRSTHGWDLSRWMTQPCIIIIGTVGSEDAGKESPVPIFVDGAKVPTKGVTVLRWIYPLAGSPPEVGKPEDQRLPAKPAEQQQPREDELTLPGGT